MGNEGSDASKRFDACFQVGRAFAARGLDIGLLSVTELSELEDLISTRLAPVFDEIVERWQDERRPLSDQDRIDRELQRRILGQRDRHDTDCECESCGYRHYEHTVFGDFHGLFLCDGCRDNARNELRDIQRPLIEALEAEPTLEHARALGFELTRGDDGRLIWLGEDDDYDGGSHPYADEQEALDDLVGELT